MDGEAIAQLISLVVAAFGIIWHQQRSSEKIRDELHESSREHRQQLQESNRQHREALEQASRRHEQALEASNRLHREDHNHLRVDFDRLREGQDRLRENIVENGVRLARIEGHLRISVPDESDQPAESSESNLG